MLECSKSQIVINDKNHASIQCIECRKWVHASCVNIKRKDLRRYVNKSICCTEDNSTLDDLTSKTLPAMSDSRVAECVATPTTPTNRSGGILPSTENFQVLVLYGVRSLTESVKKLQDKVESYSDRLTGKESELKRQSAATGA